MLIKETRPKRRNYTIALFSTDGTSYTSDNGTPWHADYFVNMNSIMSVEEQARPYFVHCTFQSMASTGMGNPSATPPVLCFLDFQNNTYSHMYTSYSIKPIGMVKLIPDLSQTAPYPCYAEMKTNDNEQIYIGSMLGVNTISVRFITIGGAMYMPTIPATPNPIPCPFTMFIHLEPADF